MPITASTIIKTRFGDFQVSFHETESGDCVSFSQGKLTKGKPIVRLHSACLFGEVFHSLHCDCLRQVTQTMALIQKNKCGVIVYSYQEGRGIGLKRKVLQTILWVNWIKWDLCGNLEVYDKHTNAI